MDSLQVESEDSEDGFDQTSDTLPTEGNEHGRAFRDLELEEEIHRLTQNLGIGAQFGGKYFCHDVRVVRLPRHGASCPVGIGVSCSADRQALAKVTPEGIFLEKLETDPSKYLPDVEEEDLSSGGDVIKIDLNKSMDSVRFVHVVVLYIYDKSSHCLISRY